MFTTYIIASERNGKWYYGHTADLHDRLERHNADRSKATKGRGPWTVVATKQFDTKAEAMAFELRLKKCKDPKRALRLMLPQGS
ncbi:MAG: GIY-YIG nuclease family protein [Flavobacteriales bacterium]